MPCSRGIPCRPKSARPSSTTMRRSWRSAPTPTCSATTSSPSACWTPSSPRGCAVASFAGAFAASHGPLIVREWQAIPADHQERLAKAYRELGKRVGAAKADVLVVVSPDHWSNFFLDNYPAVCVGVGETNAGPPEPWMKNFPHREIPGHPEFAFHLVKSLEPSISHRLKLDHGICIPLWRMELEKLPAIVPMLVNSIEPPMPSLARCLEWGKLLRKAIETFPGDLRVGVLATGGLSHSIGEKTMG